MRVIMSGGGTGGHIYPAIAIADKIKEKNPAAEILFVGTSKGLESTLVPKNGYPIKFITVRGVSRKSIIKNIKTFMDLRKGSREARAIIKEFKPDIVVGTGGYVCGPVVREAAKMGVDAYIHEQNALPGLTNKLLERYAKKVFLAFGEAEPHFKRKDKLEVTGNPVRKAFYNAEKIRARRTLSIPDDAFVLLSFGGSRGAGKINQVMFPVMETFNGSPGVFTVYVTGKYYYSGIMSKIEENRIKLSDNVRVMEYLDNMDLYLAAADLVISRAGALTVSEITVCGKASVLVPSPNVTGNHQYYNAKAVADKGGAVLMEEASFNDEALISVIMDLMNHREKLKAIEEASRRAASPDAAELIYGAITK